MKLTWGDELTANCHSRTGFDSIDVDGSGFNEKIPWKYSSSDELFFFLLATAICILQQQFPYFLITRLSVGNALKSEGEEWLLQLIILIREAFNSLRSGTSDPIMMFRCWAKALAGSEENVAFCVCEAIRAFALLSLRTVKICEASQSSNGRNELHAVR